MSAKYSVVQYVPDPVAGERINVGVITWDAQTLHARFLENWSRARQFGGENTEFLKDFAEKIRELADSDIHAPLRSENGPAYIEKIIQNWHESIQFTDPRGSLEDAPALLESIAARVLRVSPQSQSPVRRRGFAARAAYRHVYNAVKHIVPEKARSLVKQRGPIRGELVQHRFDVVVGNGTPVAGVNALSFEVKSGESLQKEIDAIAWAVDDVRKRDRDMPLAIFALPPPDENLHALFDRANKTFRGLNASVVTTDIGMSRWSNAQAEVIAAY